MRKFKRKYSEDYKIRMSLGIVFMLFSGLSFIYNLYIITAITAFGSLMFFSLALSMDRNSKFKNK